MAPAPGGEAREPARGLALLRRSWGQTQAGPRHRGLPALRMGMQRASLRADSWNAASEAMKWGVVCCSFALYSSYFSGQVLIKCGNFTLSP